MLVCCYWCILILIIIPTITAVDVAHSQVSFVVDWLLCFLIVSIQASGISIPLVTSIDDNYQHYVGKTMGQIVEYSVVHLHLNEQQWCPLFFTPFYKGLQHVIEGYRRFHSKQ